MSDSKRQDFSDKAKANLKPESEKSTTESVGDSVKGHADNAASTLQPQSEKSTSQKMGDSLSGNSNNNDQSLLDKTKDTLGMNK
ncbi:heat shock protein 9/12-domain-containing protein [Rhodocollybia butyracea]|uniref:Heat shock protein 9/12-domain-containing protein n=1 Tax=Rhodocollybia butyracea TaxID=206335 RepID=A0A9P5P521_9AGAR|nr:heat shock protein 9/12-domain-containing protein [Rhodocollybia butyracea]KAF9068800.1 heat shock protein 9/12-domain-containing protein [Rhodocollybia butyracea]